MNWSATNFFMAFRYRLSGVGTCRSLFSFGSSCAKANAPIRAESMGFHQTAERPSTAARFALLLDDLRGRGGEKGQAERQLCLLRVVQPGIAGGRVGFDLHRCLQPHAPSGIVGRLVGLAAVLGQVDFAEALSLMARSPAAAARCCSALLSHGHPHRELLGQRSRDRSRTCVDRKCTKNTGVLFPTRSQIPSSV